MTIPSNWIFPAPADIKTIENADKFLKDLVVQLQTMYEQIAQGVNGDIKSDSFTQQENWTPTLNGSVAGTFTYDHQIGWVLRQGLNTDLYFDVQWTATTAGGNLYLELPYRVANSTQMPFVGVLQPSSINFGAGNTNLVINGIPSTYRGEIWSIGSTIATANLVVPATGRLIGNIRYIGVRDE